MAKQNKRATLEVLPDALPTIAALLPSGYHIVGSEKSMGFVALVLEGESVEADGEKLQVVVINDRNERRTLIQRDA